MIFKYVLLILLNNLFLSYVISNPIFSFNKDELSASYWNNLSKKDIELTKNRRDVIRKAKNAILFIGDGMGLSTLTGARILKGQLNKMSGEEGSLFFETFPNSALIKTYNVDKQVPDSAGTATAYLTGVKTNLQVIGVGPEVTNNETDCNKIEKYSVNSFLESARKSGKSIGLVTNTRITHATPAAAYAHSSNRNYEVDFNLPIKMKQNGCKDIARQLIENQPGISFNVIFGGGKKYFIPSIKKTNNLNDSDETISSRQDGLNLIDQWLKIKKEIGIENDEYKFISNLKELQQLDTEKINYVLGLFADNHLPFSKEYNENSTQPKLELMVEKATKILAKNPNGYILLVEGGRIDHAHHRNLAKLALYETVELDKVIQKTMTSIDKENTLVVVTADHSHSLTINGYPERGNNIFGHNNFKNLKTNESTTTLLYSSGPGHYYENDNSINDQFLNSMNYQFYSAYEAKFSNHAGEDVPLYATGPMSYMFRGLHEQNYISHVISYSTCIGLYQNETHCKHIIR